MANLLMRLLSVDALTVTNLLKTHARPVVTRETANALRLSMDITLLEPPSQNVWLNVSLAVMEPHVKRAIQDSHSELTSGTHFCVPQQFAPQLNTQIHLTLRLLSAQNVLRAVLHAEKIKNVILDFCYSC